MKHYLVNIKLSTNKLIIFLINFQPDSIVHDMRKLVTSDEKKVITLFLEFRLKFLGFLRHPNEISGNGKHSKFSSLHLVQVFC